MTPSPVRGSEDFLRTSNNQPRVQGSPPCENTQNLLTWVNKKWLLRTAPRLLLPATFTTATTSMSPIARPCEKTGNNGASSTTIHNKGDNSSGLTKNKKRPTSGASQRAVLSEKTATPFPGASKSPPVLSPTKKITKKTESSARKAAFSRQTASLMQKNATTLDAAHNGGHPKHANYRYLENSPKALE